MAPTNNFIGFLTTDVKELFLPRVLHLPLLYNLVGLSSCPHIMFSGIQCSSWERPPASRPISQGDTWVAAPMEQEGCDLCEAISTLRAQIGLFFQEGFGAFLWPLGAAPCGGRALSLTFLACGQGGWLWKGILRSGGLFLGVGFLVPDEGQAIKEGGPAIRAAVGSGPQGAPEVLQEDGRALPQLRALLGALPACMDFLVQQQLRAEAKAFFAFRAFKGLPT